MILTSIFNIATRFIGQSIRKDCLDRLPSDVLVDVVFDYLDVVDIMKMRRVSRLYYKLTYQAIIWKRFLRRIDVPLPPMPLSDKRPLSKLTGSEAERIVVRAYSMDMNWRQPFPRALREWSFDAQRRVHDMVLITSGEYLIASVSNRQGTHYNIVVYAMNHPGAPRALTAVETTSKAYDLQVKLMTIKGERSIVIAFLQRQYRKKKDRAKATQGFLPDVSSYSTQYPISEVQFKYQCNTMQISIDTLEALSYISYPTNSRQFRYVTDALPKPFINLYMMTSKRQLSSPVLAEMLGCPYLALVRGENEIIFKRLEGGDIKTLTCLEQPIVDGRPHHIKAIQLLSQDAVFVVRETSTASGNSHECPAYIFEIYPALLEDMPSQSLGAEQCTVSYDLGHLTHIYLPEFPSLPLPEPIAEDNPRLPALLPTTLRRSPPTKEPWLPPPICVLGRSHPQCGREESLVRLFFLAQQFQIPLAPTPDQNGNPVPNTQITYQIMLERNQKWEYKAADYNAYLRIVPGATRPLVYTIPWDDTTDAPRVLDMQPIVDHGWMYPPRVEDGVVRHPRVNIECPAFGGRPAGLDANVSAFAWNETIGRLLVAEEASTHIKVFDFAAGLP